MDGLELELPGKGRDHATRWRPAVWKCLQVELIQFSPCELLNVVICEAKQHERT